MEKMRKFWLVWNGGDWTEFASSQPRCEHMNKYTADDEAKRLARLHPGQKFFVLEALRYWERDDMRVVDLEDPVDDGEECPF